MAAMIRVTDLSQLCIRLTILIGRENSTGQEESARACCLACEQASQEPEQEAAAIIVESVLDDVQAATCA